MARGDILLVALPDSDKREEKGNRPAIIKTIGTLEPEYLAQLNEEIQKMLLPDSSRI